MNDEVKRLNRDITITITDRDNDEEFRVSRYRNTERFLVVRQAYSVDSGQYINDPEFMLFNSLNVVLNAIENRFFDVAKELYRTVEATIPGNYE